MAEHVPEELMEKILTRLPVESILRFSCVSKRWRSIIFDPQFAKPHYKVSSEQQTPNKRRLLTSTFTEVESVDLGAPSSASPIRKLAAPFKQPESGIGAVKLLGSCNGLVCVAQYFTRSPYISSMYRNRLVRIEHEQDKRAIERDKAPDRCNFMIVYQECLLWIDEYLTAEDKVNTGK